MTSRELERLRECLPKIEVMLARYERDEENRRALWLAAAKWMIGAFLAATSAALVLGLRAWIDAGPP